jgi:hypothetical protein
MSVWPLTMHTPKQKTNPVEIPLERVIEPPNVLFPRIKKILYEDWYFDLGIPRTSARAPSPENATKVVHVSAPSTNNKKRKRNLHNRKVKAAKKLAKSNGH